MDVLERCGHVCVSNQLIIDLMTISPELLEFSVKS